MPALAPSLAGFSREVVPKSINCWSLVIVRLFCFRFVRVTLASSYCSLYKLMKVESRHKAWPLKHRAKNKQTKSIQNVLSAMTYLPGGLGLARGGEGPAPGSRDNAAAWRVSTFAITQCSLSSQTKKYADVIIPRGADNEGRWTQSLLLCPGSQLWAVLLQ